MSYGFQTYMVDGKPVPDIKAWARERNQQMVVIEWTKNEPNIFAGNMIEHKWEDEMPESWWRNFGWNSMQGHPREIRRYDP